MWLRALRSESKSGYDKSLRKGGAGPHNWGSVRDEYELEQEALEDNDFDTEEFESPAAALGAAEQPAAEGTSEEQHQEKTSAAVSEDEVAKAREFRAKALKDGNSEWSFNAYSARI